MAEIDDIETTDPTASSGDGESQLEALPEGTVETGGEASPESGAAVETISAPTVEELAKTVTELRDKFDRSSSAYDNLMSEKMRADFALKSTAEQNRILSERLEKLEKKLTQTGDKELVQELQNGLDQGNLTAEQLLSFIDRRAEQKAQQVANPLVQNSMSTVQSQIEADRARQRSENAFNTLKSYATEKLKLSQDEFNSFMNENRDQNGIPFGWVSPEDAVKKATEQLNGRYIDRVKAVVPKMAAKAGSEAAQKRLVSAGVGNTASVQGGTGGEVSPSDEFIEMLRTTEI